jgi:hypothetical protein
MRILFDENFPADFAALLVGHEACIVTAGQESTFPRMTQNGQADAIQEKEFQRDEPIAFSKVPFGIAH